LSPVGDGKKMIKFSKTALRRTTTMQVSST